jgi:hypothetical protein
MSMVAMPAGISVPAALKVWKLALMGGDQITCGVQNALVACILIEGFSQNHGDDTAQRHGFVLNPQRSWTF